MPGKIVLKSGRRNKYHAKKTKVLIGRRTRTFDSSHEATHALALHLSERAGLISNLRFQVKFPLVVNGVLITTYIADFVYTEKGVEVVEDAKGMRTREYKLKAKLFEALHGFAIKEV